MHVQQSTAPWSQHVRDLPLPASATILHISERPQTTPQPDCTQSCIIPSLRSYNYSPNTMHSMRAFSAICTCSGTGLPDWTLELLHAHRIHEARMALPWAIPFTNTMLRPLSRSNPPCRSTKAGHNPTCAMLLCCEHLLYVRYICNCDSPIYRFITLSPSLPPLGPKSSTVTWSLIYISCLFSHRTSGGAEIAIGPA